MPLTLMELRVVLTFLRTLAFETDHCAVFPEERPLSFTVYFSPTSIVTFLALILVFALPGTFSNIKRRSDMMTRTAPALLRAAAIPDRMSLLRFFLYILLFSIPLPPITLVVLFYHLRVISTSDRAKYVRIC